MGFLSSTLDSQQSHEVDYIELSLLRSWDFTVVAPELSSWECEEGIYSHVHPPNLQEFPRIDNPNHWLIGHIEKQPTNA